jgi:hypothetical protein
MVEPLGRVVSELVGVKGNPVGIHVTGAGGVGTGGSITDVIEGMVVTVRGRCRLIGGDASP